MVKSKAHRNRMRLEALRVLIARDFPAIAMAQRLHEIGAEAACAPLLLPNGILLYLSNHPAAESPLFALLRTRGGPRTLLAFENMIAQGVRGRAGLTAGDVAKLLGCYLAQDGSVRGCSSRRRRALRYRARTSGSRRPG